MKQVSFKGVAIGNVVDIVSSNIVTIPLAIYILASPGSMAPPDNDAVKAILRASTVFLVVSSVLGGLCSVLGGYVSARIARHDEVLNGALASILCVGLGIYAVVSGTGHLWLNILYLPLSPALAALGGYLRSQQAAGAG